MKTKLTINALVKNNLRRRKKQYVLMFVGILLSMIFSSTILFFVSSLSTSAKEYYKLNYGDFEMFLYGESLDKSFYEDAKQTGKISDYGFAHTIGKLYNEEEGDDPKINVGYLDEKGKKLYNVSVLEGEYPSAPGEIAFEKTIAAVLVPSAEVGDTVTLFVKGQNGNKFLDGYSKKTFKLVGILRNKMANITAYRIGGNLDYAPTAFVFDSSDALPGSKAADVAYVKTEKGEAKTKDWQNTIATLDKTGKAELCEYNESPDVFDQSNTRFFMIIGIVFTVVLLLASFIAIINSMNSNIADRKKQIGMLRTVGATKRQIRKIFGREAVVISLVCAPLSAVVSYLIVKLSSKIFGEEFVFVLNLPVLFLSVVFGVFCVILASSIPLSKASGISPVQSIRNIDITRKMKTKKIKSKNQFNMSKLLAKRNIGFYRTKQIVVSVFLIVTIAFSCFGFALIKLEMGTETFTSDYTVSIPIHGYGYYTPRSNNGFNENIRKDILNIPYIDYVNGIKDSYVLIEHDGSSEYIEILNEAINAAYEYDESDPLKEAKTQCKTDNELFQVTISSFDEDSLLSLKPYLSKGKIDMKALDSGKEVILLAPDKVGSREEIQPSGARLCWIDTDEQVKEKNEYIKRAERDIAVGDKLTLDVLLADVTESFEAENIELLKNEVEIGAHIKNLPVSKQYDMWLSQGFYLITSHEGMRKLCGDVGYCCFSSNLSDSARETLTEEIDNAIMMKLELLKMYTDDLFRASSNYRIKTETELTGKTLFIALLSIMILLMAGSISIINNSLSSRIRESKREIGTLRAVGATQKDLTMSYVRQLLSMFGWGTGIGFALFFAVYIGMRIYNRITGDYELMISFTVWPAIVAVVILFAVCSINLYLKIKKETKNSIIDNIREL